METARSDKPKLTKSEIVLRDKISDYMMNNGFKINPHLRLPDNTKQTYRQIQQALKYDQVLQHMKFLQDNMELAERFCRSGEEITPECIELEIREVKPNSMHAKLFLWWNLVWWSMPYQAVYGRSMRFVLWDTVHDAPFGLLQLQSPVLHMGIRDSHLDLPKNQLDVWVNRSMSAQRIGALPPYNQLLGGKMTALTVASDEIRNAYRSKYAGRVTVMNRRMLDPDLLWVTTTSAFGKSSMYDRLAYHGRLVATHIGHTKGMGTFHLSNELKNEMYAMLESHGVDTRTGYGHGPSRKIGLFKKAFTYLGLPGFYSHGIRRGVYLFELAENIQDVIKRGEKPRWFRMPFSELVSYWKDRWALPRSQRMPQWKKFDSEQFFEQTRQTLGQFDAHTSGGTSRSVCT